MTGVHVVSGRGASAGAIVWAVLAAGLASLAMFPSTQPAAWLAVLPALYGLICLAPKRRAFAGTVTQTGLLPDHGGAEIPFSAIESLWAVRGGPRARKRPGRVQMLQLAHPAGIVVLRTRSNPPLEDVYEFLLEKLGLGGSRDVNPMLAAHLQAAIDTFGPERVFSYAARKRQERVTRDWVFAAATSVSGVVWLIVSGRDSELLLACGAIAMIVGLTIALLLGLFGKRLRPQTRDASLLITPAGLALKQLDAVGELRWDEILAIRRGSGEAQAFKATPISAALRLTVEGAEIVVLDCYDRPLDAIERVIRRYWAGGAAAAARPAEVPPQ